MSMAKIGKKVAVVGHLECPDGSTLYVQAVVKDDAETLVTTIGLSDQGAGRFTGEYTMPDRPWVQATLTVYDDVGYTMPNSDFCPITQVTQRDDSSIFFDSGVANRLVGTVNKRKLSGKIEEKEKLSGIIKSKKLAGEIQDKGKLSGILNNIRLLGSI